MTPWASFEAHRRAREGAASNEEYDDAISGDLRALNFDPEHMAKTLSDTKPNESLERDRRRCLRGTLQTHTLLYRECGNETESVAHPHTQIQILSRRWQARWWACGVGLHLRPVP